MRIGIFLGYGPQTNLRKEGLGRALADNIKGFINGNKITIACPKWLKKSVVDLLEDHNIDKNMVSFITTSFGAPPIWHVYELLTRKKGQRGLKKRIFTALLSLVIKAGSKLAKSKTFVSFIFWIIIDLLLGILLLIPVLLVCFLIGNIAFLFANNVRIITRIIIGLIILVMIAAVLLGLKIKEKNKEKNINKSSTEKKSSEKETSLPKKIKKFLKKYLPPDILVSPFQDMIDSASEELVRKINNTNSSIDVWYIPALFWPQVTSIRKAPIVLNAPDLVSEEFPIGFSSVESAVYGAMNCRNSLMGAKYFITYSEYLRKQLLINEYGKDENDCIAIPHSSASLYSYLKLDVNADNNFRTNKNFEEEYAKELLDSLHIGLRDERYIFYCSQSRPSKNLLTLIKAYEYLVRKRFNNIKLVLTCKIESDEQLEKYLDDNDLHENIVFCHNVSTAKLAALYYCADIVVNPTLYEGGFPFTFCEGMSVGTPSLMSRIPQVQEVLEPAGLEEIMFDPFSWEDLANKIEYWLSKKEKLYEKELPLYSEMAKRTPEVVANDYVKAFEYFIKLDKASRGI